MTPNLCTENPEQAFDVLPFLENYLAKETAKADPTLAKTLAKIRTNVAKIKAYSAEIIIHKNDAVLGERTRLVGAQHVHAPEVLD